MQRFTDRVSEIVNIPGKPTPIGFKIWVIAYNGYVLDHLWHAKEDVAKDYGPQALDPKWREIINNPTQQVVLQLLENLEDSDKDHMA
jgi:hypothetical protein